MYYKAKRKKGRIVVVLIVMLFILYGAYFISGIGFHPIKIYLPKNHYFGNRSYTVLVKDNKAAIKQIRITVVTAFHTYTLLNRRFNKISGANSQEVKFSLPNTRSGNAKLVVYASDSSMRHFFQGSQLLVQKEIIIDKNPPKIDIYGLPIRIDRGGAGFPIWTVKDKNLKDTWVTVNGYKFRGYNATALLGKANAFAAFMAYPVNSNNSRIGSASVSAIDKAGNETTVHLPVYWKYRTFRKVKINIGQIMLAKAENVAGKKKFDNNTKLFLYINRKLRKDDNDKIQSVSSVSINKFLWKGRFLQLPHSEVTAEFEDLRTYLINNIVVDHERHLGYDLASIAHSKVPAAAGGIVQFTGHLYLYGNVIILDHGFGLSSLYAHLSEIDVKVGQSVKKGDIIGVTGQTGMAGGDHLHFGIYISGIPVDPIYFWDKNWVKEHIADRIESAKLEIP